MYPLHATIEEFAAEGYTHVECFCPRCRVIRLRPISELPKISLGLTLDALARRLRCAKCGGPLQSVKPWRQSDMLGKRARAEGVNAMTNKGTDEGESRDERPSRGCDTDRETDRSA